VIDIPSVPEAVCGPRFVHSDIAPVAGRAWTLVTGPAAADLDHWVEPDDPPQAIPDGFGGSLRCRYPPLIGLVFGVHFHPI
jgi:hypothetical protein